MNRNPGLIVALDFDNAASARALVDCLDPGRCRLKVGKELFTRAGPSLVGEWVQQGWEVFLDLKFHDIPNTVHGACRAATELGVWMLNVHALGGPAMLAAAREAVDAAPAACRPLLTAVTVLTSHDATTLQAIGLEGSPEAAVSRLAVLAADAGLDGVVCSPREASMLRARAGSSFRLVTPGVRPAGTAADDQRRVETPAAALAAGATDLVIGRPITRASDPAAAVEMILDEMRVTTGSEGPH